MDKSSKYTALLLVSLTAFLGGGISSLAKIGLREIPPLTFTLLRFLSVGFILFPLFLQKEKNQIRLNDLKSLVLISLLATSNVTFFILGVKYTTATAGQMIYAAVPILAGVFSCLFLKEKLILRKIVGIMIGFIGVLTIILLPILSQGSAFAGNLIGNLLIFIAAASFSLYSVLSKKYQPRYSPLSLTVVFILTTIFILFFLAPFELKANPHWWRQISLSGVLGLLYVGLIGTGIYYLLYQYALKKATPIIASMTFYLQPIFSFVWAYFLLGERLTLGFIAGAVLAFGGAYLVTSSKKYIYTAVKAGKPHSAPKPVISNKA